MIYESWFGQVPSNWIKVAILKLPAKRVTPVADVVSFYSTSPAAAADFARAIDRYQAENPSKASMVQLLP